MSEHPQIRDDRRHSFVIVDNEVIDAGLRPNALATYLVLLRFANQAGECFPSLETIGKMLGTRSSEGDLVPLSRPSVLAALKELRDQGLVEIRRRHLPNGTRASNSYRILPVLKADHVNVVYMAEGQPCKPALPSHVKQVYTNKTPGREQDSESSLGEHTSHSLSPHEVAFWQLFEAEHWTVLAKEYTGLRREISQDALLSAIAALDPLDQRAVVCDGLKRLANAGERNDSGGWPLYADHLSASLSAFKTRQAGEAAIGHFSRQLVEALQRIGQHPVLPSLTPQQRTDIVSYGVGLSADDLEEAILVYQSRFPERGNFNVNQGLGYILKVAHNRKAIPARGNGSNGKAGHYGGNGHNGRRGTSAQLPSNDDYNSLAREVAQRQLL